MLVHRKESETKAALKPAGNIVCAIFGRSKAKDRNDVNDITITVRLQDFGTRLSYKIYSLIINAFLAQRVQFTQPLLYLARINYNPVIFTG